MRITADINKVELQDFEPLISGAYRDKTIDVELSEEYDGMSVWAIFDTRTVKVEGGKCFTPTLAKGLCSVGIYAVKMNEDDEITLRYSPAPAEITVEKGSYNVSLQSASAPTETEAERIYALIDKAIQDGKMKGQQGDKGDKGEQGEPGKDGINGKDGTPGTTVYSELTDKPSINNVILEGNKTLEELGIDIPTKTSELENDSNFVSDLTDYIKNTDYAALSKAGLVQFKEGVGVTNGRQYIGSEVYEGVPVITRAQPYSIKEGSNPYMPIVPSNQHQAAFYGLAKASGDSTQSKSANAVGDYTDEAKTSIQEMLGVQPKLTAGENISIANNVISASCVVKPLQLSENKVTLLTDIVKDNPKGGAYVVTQNGYIQTTGGYKTLIGAGSEFIITLTSKSGNPTLIATVQTGSTIVRIDDDMTANDSVRRFIDTSNLISDPAAASLRNTFNASAIVGMLDKKQEYGWKYKVEKNLTEAVKAVSLTVNNDITEFIGEFYAPTAYTANSNFRPYINEKIISNYTYGGNNMKLFHLHCYLTPATPFYSIFSKGIDPGSIAAATGFINSTTEPITSVGIYYGVEIPVGTKVRILAR